MAEFHNLKMSLDGSRIEFLNGRAQQARGMLSLVVIQMAWGKGANFEDLADGFGAGMGTKGDWSAIRDSSLDATSKMLERSLNFLNNLKP